MASEEVTRRLGMLQAIQAMLLTGVVLLLAVLVGMSGCSAVRAERNAVRVEAVARETHRVLCSIRRGIEKDVRDGEKYVAEVVSGKRELLPTFTLEEIRALVAEDRERFNELAILDCEGEG